MEGTWVGPCPKCGYERTAADANPGWQCPRCLIAYAKFVPRPAAVHSLARHGRAMAHEAGSDLSLFWLIVANVIAAAIALRSRMDLGDLMLVYWIQSVIIGVAHFIRIFNLERFSTEGMLMNGRPVPYARIIPMHLTIITGGLFFGTGLYLFIALKIAADAVMHTVEHHVLAARRD